MRRLTTVVIVLTIAAALVAASAVLSLMYDGYMVILVSLSAYAVCMVLLICIAAYRTYRTTYINHDVTLYRAYTDFESTQPTTTNDKVVDSATQACVWYNNPTAKNVNETKNEGW